MRMYLVGFMGSGKSSIGKRVAKLLNWEFVDLDEQIQQAAGKTIAEIFANEGEDAFRRLEQKVLHHSFNLDHALIATGGGTPCFYDNIDAIRKHGMSIYLRCSVDYLSKKLMSSKRERPLVKSKSAKALKAFITEKLSDRDAYYLQAQHVISWESYTKEQAAKIIAGFVL